MSRWLNSVGNFLEKLDDVGEKNTGDLMDLGLRASRNAAARFRIANPRDIEVEGIEDYPNDDDEEELDSGDEEYLSEELYSTAEESNIIRITESGSGEEPDYDDEEEEGDTMDVALNLQHVPQQTFSGKHWKEVGLDAEEAVSAATEETSAVVLQGASSLADLEVKPPSIKQPNVSSKLTPKEPPKKPDNTDIPTPTPGASSKLPQPSANSMAVLQQQLKKQHAVEISKIKKANEALVQKLTSENEKLESTISSLERELKARNRELDEAAGIVEKERKALKAEKEELLLEQEEEIQELKEQYEEKIRSIQLQLDQQRQKYHLRMAELEKEAKTTDKEHHAQFLDLQNQNQQLNERIEVLEADAETYKSQVTTLTTERDAFQQQIVNLQGTLQNSLQMAEAAELQLDELRRNHQNQINARLERESELEQTVAHLSSQLAQQLGSETTATSSSNFNNNAMNDNPSFISKEQYQEMMDTYKEQLAVVQYDLEGTKEQFQLVQQKCQTLQTSLDELARERNAEVEALRNEYESKLADCKKQQQQSHLLHSSRSQDYDNNVESSDTPTNVSHWQNLLDSETRKNRQLLEQLNRQTNLSEASKAEVLALKGRLQVAISRAEAAETTRDNAAEIELDYGGEESASRQRHRRTKRAGGPRFNSLQTRSIRAAIGLRYPAASRRGGGTAFQQQILETIDAMDNWMMETGNILRHEPLARLGFALYLTILHAWCFGLVFYHFVDVEKHGDLGALTEKSRFLHHAIPQSGQ
jgi:myosin heavy subunit